MAAKYNFPQIYQGDTFEQRVLQIKENDVLVDLTNSKVDLMLMIGDNNRVVKKLPTKLGSGTGELILDSWNVDVDDYIYNYQLKITIDEKTLTYLTGCFPVKKSFE